MGVEESMDEALLNRSYAAFLFDEVDEYEEAIALFTKAIGDDPSDYIALNNRGVAYWEIGRDDEAMQDLLAAARLAHADDPIPRRNLEAFQTRGRE
jgi:Flp pilus assembly protein TadD